MPDLRFYAIEDRKFLTVEYEPWLRVIIWPNDGTPEDAKGAVVRVRYATTEDAPVDESAVRNELIALGASRVFIQGTVERTSRARVEVADESVGPDEGLELWLTANEMSAGPAATLRVKHREYAERVH